jgi:hypothetical protein
LDVIWTLVESSVKRVEHCAHITRILTVLLPVMYVRIIEIFYVHQQTHTGKLGLSVIIY